MPNNDIEKVASSALNAAFDGPAITGPGKVMRADAYAAQTTTPGVQGYGELERILKLAYQQAATGKGHVRHASSAVGYRAWEDQASMQDIRQIGPAAPAFQVSKKVKEAVTMAGNYEFDKAKAEALGAITYAAKLYKLLEEMEATLK